LATGIFNAGSNVGALLTPLVVAELTLVYGWPAAFYVTGAFGFFWLVWWLWVFRPAHEHPRLSRRELDYICSDPPDPPIKISWLELLRHRQTWAFVIGMLLSSPIWWFYLYWAADFLRKNYGLSLNKVSLPLVVIYLIADVGSVGGGWLSSSLIKRGWTVNAARKTALLLCALCVVPVFAATQVTGLWAAVILIGIAAAAHQGFSANLYTLVSDTVPRKAVSSVVGIGGMAGALGGIVFAKMTGYILEYTKSYTIPFLIASSIYLLNLVIIHGILPKLEPMEFKEKQPH
jgi:ACS family hexuronate transporter-like MFS transporter